MTDSSRCPSPEQIAAFVAGSLAGDELTMVMEHIQTCDDCRLVLTDTALIDRAPEFADVAPPLVRPRMYRWWVVAAAAAAVVLIALAVLSSRPRVRDPREAIGRLVAAAPRDGRYLEPRLSGDFAWAPILPVRRAADQPLDPREMKLIGVAGEVLEQTANDPSPEAQHAAALAHLLAGRPNEAASLLTKLAASSKNASVWSDLAAARLCRRSPKWSGAAIRSSARGRRHRASTRSAVAGGAVQSRVDGGAPRVARPRCHRVAAVSDRRWIQCVGGGSAQTPAAPARQQFLPGRDRARLRAPHRR